MRLMSLLFSAKAAEPIRDNSELSGAKHLAFCYKMASYHRVFRMVTNVNINCSC